MVLGSCVAVRVVAVLLVLAALIVPVSAVADTASVSVFAQLTPAACVEIVEGGILVRSNAPWELVLEVVDAEGSVCVVSRRGMATGAVGSLVVAEDLIAYSLVLEPSD